MGVYQGFDAHSCSKGFDISVAISVAVMVAEFALREYALVVRVLTQCRNFCDANGNKFCVQGIDTTTLCRPNTATRLT